MSDNNITNLRKFHNWVKKSLIQDTADYIKKTFGITNLSLLELAVGRGGDINKWYDANIFTVYGFDIDEPSVKGKNGAIQRLNWLMGQLRRNNQRVPDYKFYVTDLSQESSIEYVAKTVAGRKFNIVSCQFAIHYFFKTAQTLDTFVRHISGNIENDGFFITTCMDPQKLIEMFKKNDVIQTKIFRFEKKYDTITGPYGNTYLANLGGESDKGTYFEDKPSLEYLVDVEELKKVCAKYNLHFVGMTGFDEWYEKFIRDEGRFPLSDLQKEFSFANMSMIFKRVDTVEFDE